jgi:hypothetical protein
MAFLGNNVFDQGLSYLQTNGSRLDICTTEPTTYGQATGYNDDATQFSCGQATITRSTPADRGGGGREITISGITSAAIYADGTGAYWAITDGSAELLATGSLAAGQVLTSGNTFDLSSFAIGIPDPA